jgi:hypothetical protein
MDLKNLTENQTLLVKEFVYELGLQADFQQFVKEYVMNKLKPRKCGTLTKKEASDLVEEATEGFAEVAATDAYLNDFFADWDD